MGRRKQSVHHLVGLSLVVTLGSGSTAKAGNNTIGCQTGTPGIPVEQFRSVPGQGTIDLWHPNLQPADPLGQPLPESRDSTAYTSSPSQLPGANGLELFYDLDILEDTDSVYLYMAFNSGFQVWDVTGPLAASPQLRSTRNGWNGDFNTFSPPQTEYYFTIFDLDAIDPPDAPGETLLAVAGEGPVGPTIWDVTNKSGPVQLYQDTGKISVQVSAANMGDRSYAFFAANNGVNVYDMTRAREVGPCFETTSTATDLCGGNADPVWRGRLEPWPWGVVNYVDALRTVIDGQERLVVVASDGFPSHALGVEIREVTDPAALPPSNSLLIGGLHTLSFGVDLFEYSGSHYLAAVSNTDLEIHDVSGCLTGIVGCTLSNPRFDVRTSLPNNPEAAAYVHYSESHGRPFLYKSFHTLCSGPTTVAEGDPEMLLELSGLATGDPIVDIRGERYLDPAHPAPRRIDYWSSYYDKSTGGYSTFSPHGGKFHGDYFYRGAQTLFDVHVWSDPTAQVQPTSPGRWLGSTTPAIPEWVDLSGECDGGVASDLDWAAANAPGTPAADPLPILEPQGGAAARVRADLCAADVYPTATCPDRTLEIDATLKCGGLVTTAQTRQLTLADPRPFFDELRVLGTPLNPDPPPVYQVGQQLTVRPFRGGSQGAAGKPATTYAWRLVRAADDEEWTCDGASAAPGLTCTGSSLDWDTAGFDPDPAVIFLDGFESGDAQAWGSGRSGALGAFDVHLTLGNEHGEIEGQVAVWLGDR